MATLGRGGPSLLQLTLALIKPDAVAHPLILEAIHQQILSSQLLIVRTRDLVWRREDCQRFYQEHAVAQSGPTYWLTRTLSSSGGPSWGQPGCSELATWPPTLSVEALASRTHAIPPMAQTRWSLPAERSRPSSLTSASAAGTRRRSPCCAWALCTMMQREAFTVWPEEGRPRVAWSLRPEVDKCWASSVLVLPGNERQGQG
ncbi:nucleoside diphosphate kinase 6 isoform X1 [Phascolarctos cinereus]|uniref:Nucleoside diphosphate kinase 6 isoform X1 n=1 Tax=Phascolarctos cinereus TaxID=38626 RepID=A0A6P5JI39_PHACI|nr:nucleoside diphosphate kinase 6 isoform X1 [Phascolarctos cinereus]